MIVVLNPEQFLVRRMEFVWRSYALLKYSKNRGKWCRCGDRRIPRVNPVSADVADGTHHQLIWQKIYVTSLSAYINIWVNGSVSATWISEMVPCGAIRWCHMIPCQRANWVKISSDHAYRIQTPNLPGDKSTTYNFYIFFGVEWYVEDNIFKL